MQLRRIIFSVNSALSQALNMVFKYYRDGHLTDKTSIGLWKLCLDFGWIKERDAFASFSSAAKDSPCVNRMDRRLVFLYIQLQETQQYQCQECKIHSLYNVHKSFGFRHLDLLALKIRLRTLGCSFECEPIVSFIRSSQKKIPFLS